MLFKGMRQAAAEGQFWFFLVEIGQKKDQKRQVIRKRHLAGHAVLFFEHLTKPAVIAAVDVKFLKFQFLFVDNNVTKHSMFSSQIHLPSV